MTDIQLYNTRTRTKEPFRPLDRKNVRMYVCGPTVYDRAHIGNARPVVVFDVLFRLLRHVYGEGAVTYARNFTDVDDRIINRAVDTKGADESLEAACRRITDQTIGWYHDDMDALGALRPSHEPRCTEYIPQMVAMTQTLIDQGHAYAAEGHVLFAVDTYPDYGKLARRSLDDMVAGSRVEVAPYKKNPMDFVLWKPSTPEQPGWDSPWGRGRPGWHIECSVMAEELLGKTFDIHGGGIDLQFPHHENEVAQSCCANRTDVMANVWMHNGFLQVEGEKMAKSLGNFFTVEDLRAQYPGEVIRGVLIESQYHQPLDWTESLVRAVFARLLKWHRALIGVSNGKPTSEFLSILGDDLNTPAARAYLDQLIQDGAGPEARGCLALLGLVVAPGGQWARDLIQLQNYNRHLSAIVLERQRAREKRDFKRADRLRDGLSSIGIGLKDSPNGPDFEIDFVMFTEQISSLTKAGHEGDQASLIRIRDLGWTLDTNSGGTPMLRTSTDIFGIGVQRLLSYRLSDLREEVQA